MAKKKAPVIEHDSRGRILVDHEEILDQNIGESCTDWVCLHASNKNLYRSMPSMIDGLKPVHRRILYTMYLSGCMTKLKKVLKLVGSVSDFHPHADATDALGKMGQVFSNNIPFIKGKGNFGSINGDDVGAARYIEAMLSDFTKKCFFKNFDMNTIDTRETYTRESVEPEFLPARYPVALLNGMMSGIGTGFCSNIPPYNFKELCEQTIALIKDPKAPITLVPDLPTGADVLDDGMFELIAEQVSELGSEKITFTAQATYNIDHEENAIHITSLPLQIMVDHVIRGIADLRAKKKLDEVKDISNLTSSHGGDYGEVHVDLVLKLTPDANPEKVMEKLLKSNVGLRKSYPVNLIMIDDFKMHFYSIRSFLLDWLDWRRDFLRSYYNNKLVSTMEEMHINDICIRIFSGTNIEKTAKMAKQSANQEAYAKALMKEYQITSLQAKTISNMKMSAFTKDSYQGFLEKKSELTSLCETYRTLLSDDHLIDKEIIDQLNDGIQCFGTPRRSRIRVVGKKHVPDTKHVIAISKDGYIKKIPYGEILGTVGQTTIKTYQTLAISNQSSIVLFDSKGGAIRLPVNGIADAKSKSIGYPITRYCDLLSDVIYSMEYPKAKVLKESDLELILITAKGYSKRTSFKEFGKMVKYQSVIGLNEGDRLVDVVPYSTKLDMDVLLYTTSGRGLRLHGSDIKAVGRTAKGLTYMDLGEKEEVAGITTIDKTKDYIVYVTANGKLKLTETKYLPISKRKGESMNLIDLGTKDILVGMSSTSYQDQIRLFRKNSDAETKDIASIPITTRLAKAQKLVKLQKGDAILGFSIVSKE